MVRCEISGIDYRLLDSFGDYAIFVQLAEGLLPPNFLLFNPSLPEEPSGADDLDRRAVAELLATANDHLPAPPQDADYIVAGQQAGLMLGPLYTFLKVVSAISLARLAQSNRSRPVLPLFWVASEDHDLLEVNRMVIHDARFVHETAIPIKRGEMPPVAEVSLEGVREPLLHYLEENLPPTTFRPWVLDLVAATDFTNYNRAFHDLLRRLFGEWQLRSIDPQALRELTAPAFSRLVSRWPEVGPALEIGGGVLQDAGQSVPLSGAAVFELVKGKRRQVLSTESQGDWRSMADAIRRHPASFSPSAALRPICQDAALPVLATLAGPSELAYLWQVLPLYELAGARPSGRYPRISASFVDGGVLRAAAKAGLEPVSLFDAPRHLEELTTRMRAGETGPEANEDHQEPGALEDDDVRKIVAHGRALLGEIDHLGGEGSPRWLRKGRASIQAGLERIVERLQQDRRGAAAVRRQRLEKVTQTLLPGNKPQERVVNLLQLLNLHGPEFIEQSIAQLDPACFQHQVAVIQSGPGEGSEKE